MPTYAQNKASICRWNEKNKDQLKEYRKNFKREHKEKYNQLRMNYYYAEKEFKAFRMIMLN